MARKKTKNAPSRGIKTAAPPASSASSPSKPTPAAQAKETAGKHRVDGNREIIESIAFALILAFLFRTFVGQAFVIPTGSMGPTLMGRNKDLVCPECGLEYHVGASSEVNQATGALIPDLQLTAVTCPNCRYTASVFESSPDGEQPIERYPSFGGDRLWVANATYEVADPLRFDVAVFKNPEQASENYIKRIVGLPGETVRIESGNLFITPPDGGQEEIARKSPKKILAVMQTVYDHDLPSPQLEAWGWPSRWESTPAEAWKAEPDTRSFVTAGTGDEEAWLRYRHLPPMYSDWQALLDRRPLERQPLPQLVSDFCGYDTGVPVPERPRWNGPEPNPRMLGLHWVGDLILECEVETLDAKGEVVLELVEAGRRFQCRFDVTKGTARLSDSANSDFATQASTSVRGRGTHSLRFANVDDQLWLWVDGDVIEFDQPTTYTAPSSERPQPEDLAPAGIASQGAGLRVSHLRLYRDLYYIATRIDGGSFNELGAITDFDRHPSLFGPPALTEVKLAEFMSDPAMWSAFDFRRSVEFELAAGQYFALGDNSPSSSDSRYWQRGHYFDEDLLIGKAFFVYWPHAWPTPWHVDLRLFGKELQVPFYPDFRRMRLIH